eukprot:g75064.t1
MFLFGHPLPLFSTADFCANSLTPNNLDVRKKKSQLPIQMQPKGYPKHVTRPRRQEAKPVPLKPVQTLFTLSSRSLPKEAGSFPFDKMFDADSHGSTPPLGKPCPFEPRLRPLRRGSASGPVPSFSLPSSPEFSLPEEFHYVSFRPIGRSTEMKTETLDSDRSLSTRMSSMSLDDDFREAADWSRSNVGEQMMFEMD